MLKLTKAIMLGSAAALVCLTISTGSGVNELLAANMYKHVDANGVEHYSDKPFKQAKKFELKVSKAVEVDERTEEQIAEAKKQERLEKQCELSRNNLAEIDANEQVTKMDVDGNEVELSPTEKAEQRAKERRYIQTYCQDIE